MIRFVFYSTQRDGSKQQQQQQRNIRRRRRLSSRALGIHRVPYEFLAEILNNNKRHGNEHEEKMDRIGGPFTTELLVNLMIDEEETRDHSVRLSTPD